MTKLLEVKHLKKEFDNIIAVNDVSFQMDVGESVGIVGESGCGKSTLVYLIAGLLKPDEGQISIQKPSPRGGKRKKTDHRINMVFQDPVDSFDSRMNVFQSLYEALYYTDRCSRKEAEKRIQEILQKVHLPKEYMERKVSSLSGGECQRVAIARVILTEPDLFIFDEATSALDVSVQIQIMRLLADLKKEKNFSYLFVSHDWGVIAQLCTSVFVMYKGRIVEEGKVLDIMKKPKHPYTQLIINCA
ncbi:MAG: ABC transporter ATP-binding protein, partial [Ruminococcus sp.]